MSFQAFLKKLQDSAVDLGRLEIKTVVTDANAGNKVMTTRIDLIDSDITNTMDVAFVTGALTDVRAFHEAQVKKAEGLLNSRVAFVAEAFEKLSAFVKDDDEA